MAAGALCPPPPLVTGVYLHKEPALVSSFGREDFLGQNIVWSRIWWEENCADIRHSSQSRVVGKLSKSCYFDCTILVKKGGTVNDIPYVLSLGSL